VKPARYLVDLPTQKTLSTIVSGLIQPYLKQQRYLAKIIRGQSVIRRVIHWRRYNNSYRYLYINTTLGKRLDVFRSLVRGEERYLEQFAVLHRTFYRRLRRKVDEKATFLTTNDLGALFNNLPEIRRMHVDLLTRLVNHREKGWPCIDGVGEIFLSLSRRMAKYEQFALDFQYCMDTLERLNGRQKFHDYVKDLDQSLNSEKLSLRKLLCLPLQRLKFYQRSLEALIKYTPSLSHALSTPKLAEDACQLKEALVELEKVQVACSRALEQSGRRSRLLNVLRTIQFEDPNHKRRFNLMGEESRRFVREGPMFGYLDGGKKKIDLHVFMFSDMCLITKPVRGKVEEMFSLSPDGEISFHSAEIIDGVDSEVISQKVMERAERSGKEHIPIFKLVNNSAKICHYMQSPTLAENYVWFLKFSQTLERSQLVFGRPLEVVLKEEGSEIPRILRECIGYLEEKALWSEGLFRVAPDQQKVKDLQARYDRAEQVDLQGYEVHTVAAVVKLFFRELPDSIFTFDFFDRITVSLNELDEHTVEFIEEALSTIPVANRNVLDYLMLFLIRLCNYSHINKMTPNNVAIVFGPTLLRPRCDTVETSLFIPKTNRFLEDTVLFYDKLYESLLFFEEDRGLNDRRPLISHVVEERRAAAERRPKNPHAISISMPSPRGQRGNSPRTPKDSAVLAALETMNLPSNVNEIPPAQLQEMLDQLKRAKALDANTSDTHRVIMPIISGDATLAGAAAPAEAKTFKPPARPIPPPPTATVDESKKGANHRMSLSFRKKKSDSGTPSTAFPGIRSHPPVVNAEDKSSTTGAASSVDGGGTSATSSLAVPGAASSAENKVTGSPSRPAPMTLTAGAPRRKKGSKGSRGAEDGGHKKSGGSGHRSRTGSRKEKEADSSAGQQQHRKKSGQSADEVTSSTPFPGIRHRETSEEAAATPFPGIRHRDADPAADAQLDGGPSAQEIEYATRKAGRKGTISKLLGRSKKRGNAATVFE